MEFNPASKKAVVELRGQASNVHLIVNLGQRYTVRRDDVIYVNLTNVNNDGYDMALKIDTHNIESFTYAFGVSNDMSVDVRLSHIWQRHDLKSNVQINTYCKRGFLGSIWYVIRKGITIFENGKFCLRVNY